MKTTYLISKAISSASKRRKIFHLSHVLFELSDFKGERDRKKPKDNVTEISKFLTLYFFKQFLWFFFNGFSPQ